MSITRAPSQFSEAKVPTVFGSFRLRVYTDPHDAGPIAIISGDPTSLESTPVRIHSACFLSENLGSLRCGCRQRLDSALEYISVHGGVVVYLRYIGALLQREHLPLDRCAYETAAQVLRDLGVGAVEWIGDTSTADEPLVLYGMTGLTPPRGEAGGALAAGKTE